MKQIPFFLLILAACLQPHVLYSSLAQPTNRKPNNLPTQTTVATRKIPAGKLVETADIFRLPSETQAHILSFLPGYYYPNLDNVKLPHPLTECSVLSGGKLFMQTTLPDKTVIHSYDVSTGNTVIFQFPSNTKMMAAIPNALFLWNNGMLYRHNIEGDRIAIDDLHTPVELDALQDPADPPIEVTTNTLGTHVFLANNNFLQIFPIFEEDPEAAPIEFDDPIENVTTNGAATHCIVTTRAEDDHTTSYYLCDVRPGIQPILLGISTTGLTHAQIHETEPKYLLFNQNGVAASYSIANRQQLKTWSIKELMPIASRIRIDRFFNILLHDKNDTLYKFDFSSQKIHHRPVPPLSNVILYSETSDCIVDPTHHNPLICKLSPEMFTPLSPILHLFKYDILKAYKLIRGAEKFKKPQRNIIVRAGTLEMQLLNALGSILTNFSPDPIMGKEELHSLCSSLKIRPENYQEEGRTFSNHPPEALSYHIPIKYLSTELSKQQKTASISRKKAKRKIPRELAQKTLTQ